MKNKSVPINILYYILKIGGTLSSAAALVVMIAIVAILINNSGTISIDGETKNTIPYKTEPGEYQIENNGEKLEVRETTQFVSDDADIVLEKTNVSIEVHDQRIKILFSALVLVGLILLAYIFYSLEKIVRLIKNNATFYRETVHFLKKTALLTMVFSVFEILITIIVGRIVDSLDLAGPPVQASLPSYYMYSIPLAIFLYVLGDVFAQGTELREFEEDTI